MKTRLRQLITTAAGALLICSYASAMERHHCLRESTSFIRGLVPSRNVRVTQSLPDFVRFTGTNVVVLSDSFGTDCLPNHVVVKSAGVIEVNKPTPSLKVVDVVSVARHKRIVATDLHGRSIEYDTPA